MNLPLLYIHKQPSTISRISTNTHYEVFQCMTRRHTRWWGEMFWTAELPSGTRLALTLLIQPCLVTVRASGTCLPVQGSACWTVVAHRTDVSLTIQHTVVASWAHVAVDRMGVVHLSTVVVHKFKTASTIKFSVHLIFESFHENSNLIAQSKFLEYGVFY